MLVRLCLLLCFFFNDTATTEIYTLSLHDALPISRSTPRCSSSSRSSPAWCSRGGRCSRCRPRCSSGSPSVRSACSPRSEEHTSELQSRRDLVCRLLLEKKKKKKKN